MDISSAWLFFMSLLTLAITPGIGAAVVVNTTLRRGWRTAIATIIGIVSADYIFVLAVFFGVHALLTSFATLFAILQWFGVCYLAFLGLQLLLTTKTKQITTVQQKGNSFISQYMLGLLVTLGNPKAIIYYSGIMPTVLSTQDVSLIQLAWIVLLVTVAIVGVMSTYCYLAHKTHSTGIINRHTRLIQRCSGIALLFTACLLALHVFFNK